MKYYCLLADTSAIAKRPRQTFSKEERELARLVHRTHALCLLAQGVLHDVAANDSSVQVSLDRFAHAMAYETSYFYRVCMTAGGSLLNPFTCDYKRMCCATLTIISCLHDAKHDSGCLPSPPCWLQACLLSVLDPELADAVSMSASSSSTMDVSLLQPVLKWFRSTFTLNDADSRSPALKASSSSAEGGNEDVLGPPIPVADQLLHCLDSKSGNAAQLTALLAATLRVMGLLVRTVW